MKPSANLAAKRKMPTKAQTALSHLSTAGKDGLDAYVLYRLLWPDGDGGVNSTKGGPSGSECAVHWLLGRVCKKHGRVVERELLCNQRGRSVAQGRIILTDLGREVLKDMEKR